MKKIISLLLIFTFGLSSCEKDDICDANTPTTPRLVISFFENRTPLVPKNVINLKVVGKDSPGGQGIIFNASGDDTTKYLTNANKISIPLKTDTDSTTYSFTYDSGNPNAAAVNTDVITFYYTRQNVYVSRACGFKTIFTLNPSSTDPFSAPFIQTDPAGDGIWMTRLILQTYNIDSENEAHIKVYF
ncbi:DUF6452 family protein [Flavobacterium chilense]|uniref:Uncharacterized protein n=1 Tax=Flavobacterium chilense TaxID=946677 RepID=A0A1M6YF84_9FLAO|nr:DUF6452 family protein [Flavobacterium chilense]SHL16783.1 hypothetical protein SAMN05444484_101548 [Flavobacterium chilense]